jgi:hypothetical protein
MRITVWFKSLWNVTVVDYSPMIGLTAARLIIMPFVLWLGFGILGNYFLDLFFTGADLVHTQIRQKPLSYNRQFTIETRRGTRFNPLDIVGVVKYADGEFLGYVAPSYTLVRPSPSSGAVYMMYPYTLLEGGKHYVFVSGKQYTPAVKHTAGLMGPATCISDFVKRIVDNTVKLYIGMDVMTNIDTYSSSVITVQCGGKTVDMYVTFSKDLQIECYDDQLTPSPS